MKSWPIFVLVALALLGSTFAASEKRPVYLSVEISRIFPDYMVAELIEFRVSSSGSGSVGNGGGTSTRTRIDKTGRMVVLTPAGKCAVGDRFDVEAWEQGTRVVAGIDDQPLRQYRVAKARRL